MTLRQLTKYRLYGPLGTFPYFGFRVHFPKGSSAFRAACQQGIFEADNTRMLQQLCRPDTYMFDVGANLGLMALPVLRCVPTSKVISFEPSPNTLPWLRRTIAASGIEDRWQLVEKAVADTPRTATFCLSSRREGLYDGLKHTQRSAKAQEVEVDITTLDSEWRRLSSPDVSVIKIDVEGGELNVLRGGAECLSQRRPFVLLEWCHLNFKAYGVPYYALLDFAVEQKYSIYALPELIPVTTRTTLNLQVRRTESFLMAPSEHQ